MAGLKSVGVAGFNRNSQLVALDGSERLLTTARQTGKVMIASWRSEGASATLGTLIVERWAELKAKLGSEFAETAIRSGDHAAWSSLARFLGSSPEARRDFLDWCGREEQIGITALKALADYWPRSDILLKQVLAIFGRGSSWNADVLPLILLAAEILRDQFLAPEHRDLLQKQFSESRDVHAAIALAIVDPTNSLLQNRSVASLDLGREHGHWLAALQIASRLDPVEDFVAVVHAMAEREVYPRHQSQTTMTAVAVERLGRDPFARALLRTSLDGELSPTAFTASAGLLAAAGHLDATGLALCAARLDAEEIRGGLPTAVLDVRLGQLRPMAHVLVDLLQAEAF